MGGIYEISVHNPAGVSRGVVTVTLDGEEQHVSQGRATLKLNGEKNSHVIVITMGHAGISSAVSYAATETGSALEQNCT